MNDAADPDPPQTMAEYVVRRADDRNVGLLAGGGSWTWQKIVAASADRARQLLAIRSDPGPFHIGVLADNTPEYLFTLFGAALSGAVVIGMNTTRSGAELVRDLEHTDCLVVLVDERNRGLLDDVSTTVPIIGFGELASPDEAIELVHPSPDDDFMYLFTSGSTGAPKAVRMSNGRAARAVAAAGWVGADDVFYSAMPLFHGNALNAIVFPALGAGATIALRDRFSASEFMSDIRECGATFFSTVGRALSYVLAIPEHPDDRMHSVKVGLVPEASPADVKTLYKRFGISGVGGYGSSENAIQMSPAPGMPKDALGRPDPAIDAAIVDPKTGVELPRAVFGPSGELLNGPKAIGEIVGRNAVDRFEGYYNNPEANAARTRNGWYHSGDLGYRDEDDFYFFAGRVGEWLRVDSENFAAAPVERVIGRFPSAAAVAVFGVPDARTADDQVMVALELRDGEHFDPDEFAAFIATQPDLSAKWVPRYVRLCTIRVGATNKMDKRPLQRDGFQTDDVVYWRPDRTIEFRLFDAVDRAGLEAQFAEHGRSPTR